MKKRMLQRRSTMDRRSYIDRRILNLGNVYPGKEQRIKKDRRKGWEDRVDWQPAIQWENFLNILSFKSS
ncbi:MAG: hypothetical protein ABIJ59_11220 [Pseudomonadota bacterium]